MRNPFFARLLTRCGARNEQRGNADLRREMLAGLSGRVVEVGPGTGLNFPHYPDTVAELLAVEPEVYLRERAGEAAAAAPVTVRVVDGTAERIPADDASVDAVALSGLLCSVPDQAAALAEFRRVLRPGGELRFYEHVRSRASAFAAYQDAMDAVWPRIMGGCRPNRDTYTAIKDAGFHIVYCRGFIFPPSARLSVVSPRIIGAARV
ncbi:class I SAM-dependent methyltransferase [Actinomadura alba]|uniref:Class I SAM-dependent methyltransferase n=1 Tax=Actinomadura alba TaxID=406431 RepID=A0ABR7LS89_9ACTN|nr:class I SAM-dependent methyltransferase [Actinomadura alba]MBC6467720.1 class I SAM-dependent methyltransferase [Actinomadura alba]